LRLSPSPPRGAAKWVRFVRRTNAALAAAQFFLASLLA
jgi:hypothetical protein